MLTPGFCVNFGGFRDMLPVVRFYSRLALIHWGRPKMLCYKQAAKAQVVISWLEHHLAAAKKSAYDECRESFQRVASKIKSTQVSSISKKQFH